MNSSDPISSENGLFGQNQQQASNLYLHGAVRQYRFYFGFYNADTQGNGTLQLQRWYHVSCSNLFMMIIIIERIVFFPRWRLSTIMRLKRNRSISMAYWIVCNRLVRLTWELPVILQSVLVVCSVINFHGMVVSISSLFNLEPKGTTIFTIFLSYCWVASLVHDMYLVLPRFFEMQH
jgi:hypothetical protein